MNNSVVELICLLGALLRFAVLRPFKSLKVKDLMLDANGEESNSIDFLNLLVGGLFLVLVIVLLKLTLFV